MDKIFGLEDEIDVPPFYHANVEEECNLIVK
jgi:hypothetical protein